jgi:hypothetical protein
MDANAAHQLFYFEALDGDFSNVYLVGSLYDIAVEAIVRVGGFIVRPVFSHAGNVKV